MRRCVFVLAAACAACGSEVPPGAAQNEERFAIEEHLAGGPEAATKRVADLRERLSTAENTCKNGPSLTGGDGSLAMSAADIAMAESIDSVSPAQEQRIRASLGAEMGLSPSEVDGWRDIYRARAAKARSELAKTERVKRGACDYLPELGAELKEAEAQLAALTKARGR